MTTLVDLPLFGATYDPARDRQRLTDQQGRVFEAWAGSGWQTADSLAPLILRRTGKRDRVESIGRQMRYVRAWAESSGEWTVEDRGVGAGAKEFRLRRVP